MEHRLQAYEDAVAAAEADQFPPCCETCRFGERTSFNGDVLYACKYVQDFGYPCHVPDFWCEHYEQRDEELPY